MVGFKFGLLIHLLTGVLSSKKLHHYYLPISEKSTELFSPSFRYCNPCHPEITSIQCEIEPLYLGMAMGKSIFVNDSFKPNYFGK